jgi:hypothetical protein
MKNVIISLFCKHNAALENLSISKAICLPSEKSFKGMKNPFELFILSFNYIFKIYLQTRKNKISKIISNEFSPLLKILNFHLKLKQFINFFQCRNHLKTNHFKYFILSALAILNLLYISRPITLFFKNLKNFFPNLFNKRNYFHRLHLHFALMFGKLNL